MKFVKLVFLFLVVSLNLYGFEPMMPGRAYEKASDDYGQVDTIVWCSADYGVDTITPSFKCYDDKEKYKFKEYSLEDFICQSRSTAFRDNYFADLYNLIVKEAPNLKEKAQKIARERITETQKECIAPRSKKFKQNCKLTFSISGAVLCSRSYYRSYTAKLALMLYESDKELFSRIYGEDYEKFKEVFEDTISISDLKFEGISAKQKEENIRLYENFKEKYKDYDIEGFGYNHCWDASYVLLVQYSLIDKNGHLVLPENRKEE